MSPAAVTVLILVLLVGIIGFDIYLARDKINENTYSAVIRNAGRKWMPLIIMISYGLGLLSGHWFWGSCP